MTMILKMAYTDLEVEGHTAGDSLAVFTRDLEMPL